MKMTSPWPLHKDLTIKELVGDPLFRERLQEMGFLKGRHFSILKSLPFGDPYVVKINELFVALRQQELECIVIEDL